MLLKNFIALHKQLLVSMYPNHAGTSLVFSRARGLNECAGVALKYLDIVDLD